MPPFSSLRQRPWLYGTAAGWLAAAAFTTVEGTLFLGGPGHLRRHGARIIGQPGRMDRDPGGNVRNIGPRAEPHPAIYLAAPVLVLAKRGQVRLDIYDLLVIAIAFLVVAAYHERTPAIKVATVLTAMTAALISASLALAGPDYVKGITSTTLARPAGTSSPLHRDPRLCPVDRRPPRHRRGGRLPLAGRGGGLAGGPHGRRWPWPSFWPRPRSSPRSIRPVSVRHLVVQARRLRRLVRGHPGRLVSTSQQAGTDWHQAWRWAAIACLLIPLFVIGSRQAGEEFRAWDNSPKRRPRLSARSSSTPTGPSWSMRPRFPLTT